MDIWEANSVSNAYTPHPCKKNGLTACTGTDCGDGDDRYKGVCDKDGCDYNPYRFGVKDFYGAGKKLDTKKKMTVVTQFVGSGTSLTDIKRFYVQDGKVFKNPDSKLSGVPGNSITESFCKAQKSVFKDNTHFSDLGGLNQMASSLAKGHVLVMSLWSDVTVRMLWLDSTYPPEKAGQPGSERGECSTDSGAPADLLKNSPDAQVTFSNIKFGPIGSTFAQPA
jgi:cellulose 1,4-beta-cellobiosidase